MGPEYRRKTREWWLILHKGSQRRKAIVGVNVGELETFGPVQQWRDLFSKYCLWKSISGVHANHDLCIWHASRCCVKQPVAGDYTWKLIYALYWQAIYKNVCNYIGVQPGSPPVQSKIDLLLWQIHNEGHLSLSNLTNFADIALYSKFLWRVLGWNIRNNKYIS